jgi:flagellar biosynthesis/type III secretory pathway chaperone
LPQHYSGLIQALVQENNELLVRVQQRARQNQLLLSHAVELMQRFINALLPNVTPTTYNDAGRLPGNNFAPTALYEAVG